MRPSLLHVSLIALLVAAPIVSAPARATEEAGAAVPAPPAHVMRAFEPDVAREFVSYLAGPHCAGRASGTQGCDQAGVYVEAHMRAWGLTPAGEDGFRQPFSVQLMPFPAQRRNANPKGGSAYTFNVCALLPGSDPVLRDEVVVVSAHYDHVGTQDGATHYDGGDDNASGTAALMLVARALAAQGAPAPRRSILVIFFSAEERGLLGSAHWMAHPTVPRQNVVCDLNMDMVGRNERDEMHVYGNGSSPDLDAAHRRVAAGTGFRWKAKVGSVFKRSDQASFYAARIPCLYFTSGLHRDYHTTNDRAERVDAAKVANVARHAFLVAWDVANRPARPRFTHMGPNASVGPLEAILDMVPRPALPARAQVPAGAGVAVVQTVIDQGAAERAGLRGGDLVLGLGETDWLPQDDPVGHIEDAAWEARKDGGLDLRVQRGSKIKLVRVDLR